MGPELTISVASSVFHGPGQYALLLGSGVSRSAGIPTGWELTLELISNLPGCPLGNEDERLGWFRDQFQLEPTYSNLMSILGPSKTDRRNLLQRFFEPTEDEAKDGIKLPTRAHHSIAKLVEIGAIRVIVTTNFDRLLEQALGVRGITPDVVSKSALIDGAIPYEHSPCMVVKLHGDYKDSDLRNTIDELNTYDEKWQRYLDQIIDTHGLIIVGWSGEYDSALVQTIMAAPNRRFTTFWAHRGEPTTNAVQIIKSRRAVEVPIESADQFFARLADLVEGLRSASSLPPQEANAQVAVVKKYCARQDALISLHDTIHEEVSRLLVALQESQFRPPKETLDKEQSFHFYRDQMARFNSISERLVASLITVAYHGNDDHARIVAGALNRLGVNFHERHQGVSSLQNYPMTLAFYGYGTYCILQSRYRAAAHIIRNVCVRDYRTLTPIVTYNMLYDSLRGESAQLLHAESFEKRTKLYTPQADYFAERIAEYARWVYAEKDRVDDAFDAFHFMVQLAYRDLDRKERVVDTFVPVGRPWRVSRVGWEHSPMARLQQTLSECGEDNPMFAEGFFDHKRERFDEVCEGVKKIVERQASGMY